ncbi:ras-like GTP-binding protein RhoL isoform X1 [Neocloeon triangulifer]|uniref:ras-like GTP-binding protein RhoL isoform X1 n=2 Tax=Neocloeon triangulifer TaxID=2078957 RepID=UPI00286FAD09|nr:ras-like GTP-binding protein RhoL isoform X1 [Neocloeon triangulifer]
MVPNSAPLELMRRTRKRVASRWNELDCSKCKMTVDNANGTAGKSSPRPLKVTAVGDGMVGKTCLLITYTNKKFPNDYVPTVFDNYADNIEVEGQEYNMTLWDTAGQEDYERLRPLSYPNTDCFLLCFSIGSRSSFENIATKWYPEIRHHCPHVPIVLVGTKVDLRSDPTQGSDAAVVSVQEGRRLCKRIKAVTVVECSAKSGENLTTVFESAVRAATKTKPNKQSSCALL